MGNLEKRIRRLERINLGLVVVAVVACLMAARAENVVTADRVVAKSFELVDSKEALRGRWATEADQPRFLLMGDKEIAHVVMGVNESKSYIGIVDPLKKSDIFLSAGSLITKPDKNKKAVIGPSTASIVMQDGTGEERIWIVADADDQEDLIRMLIKNRDRYPALKPLEKSPFK